MGPLTTGMVCLLCATQPAELPKAVVRWEPMIAQASLHFAIPEQWIARVMAQESAGATTLNGRPITSNVGAMGLMQIMPNTYIGLRQRYGFGANAYDPHDNIFAGAAYLHELYQRYGYPNLFAAYHAGPSRLDAYLTQGRPLPSVTMAYVAAVTGAEYPNTTTALPSKTTRFATPSSALFFVNRASESGTDAATAPSSLFVALSPPQR